MASFNSTIFHYRELLSEQQEGHLELPNDMTWEQSQRRGNIGWPMRLISNYTEILQQLRRDILAFYGGLDLPIATKTNDNDRSRVLKDSTDCSLWTWTYDILRAPPPPERLSPD